MGICYDSAIVSISFPAKCVSWTISLGEELQTRGTKVESYVCRRQSTNQRSKGYCGKDVFIKFVGTFTLIIVDQNTNDFCKVTPNHFNFVLFLQLPYTEHCVIRVNLSRGKPLFFLYRNSQQLLMKTTIRSLIRLWTL